MDLKIKAFGITKDIVGGREMTLNTDVATVAELRAVLNQRYPRLTTLKSLFIAINNAYSEDTMQIHEMDEIALIPPVSGG